MLQSRHADAGRITCATTERGIGLIGAATRAPALDKSPFAKISALAVIAKPLAKTLAASCYTFTLAIVAMYAIASSDMKIMTHIITTRFNDNALDFKHAYASMRKWCASNETTMQVHWQTSPIEISIRSTKLDALRFWIRFERYRI